MVPGCAAVLVGAGGIFCHRDVIIFPFSSKEWRGLLVDGSC
jgi:hypothetical protein